MTKENIKVFTFMREGVSLIGFAVGIVLFAIGAVMFLQALLKLYVFKIETSYYYADISFRCERFNPDAQMVMPNEAVGFKGQGVIVGRAEDKKDKEAQEKKYQECIKKEEEKAKERYRQDKKSDMADGIAFLIASAVLIFVFRKKKN